MHYLDTQEQLKQHGLRNTQDRRKILCLFIEDRVWTAAQVHAQLPKMDLSTIYRNLQKFLQVGIILEIHAHDGQQHFERDHNEHHDHHVCENCDVIECVPCPIPKQETHHLELIGTCVACS